MRDLVSVPLKRQFPLPLSAGFDHGSRTRDRPIQFKFKQLRLIDKRTAPARVDKDLMSVRPGLPDRLTCAPRNLFLPVPQCPIQIKKEYPLHFFLPLKADFVHPNPSVSSGS